MSLQKLGDQNHLAQIENKLGITVFHLITYISSNCFVTLVHMEWKNLVYIEFLV